MIPGLIALVALGLAFAGDAAARELRHADAVMRSVKIVEAPAGR